MLNSFAFFVWFTNCEWKNKIKKKTRPSEDDQKIQNNKRSNIAMELKVDFKRRTLNSTEENECLRMVQHTHTHTLT